jgi:hypothetical protein
MKTCIVCFTPYNPSNNEISFHRYIRGDQEGLFKLVTLERILNRITGVTSGCWWFVVVNAVLIYQIFVK